MARFLIRWACLVGAIWAAAWAAHQFGFSFTAPLTQENILPLFLGAAILGLLNATLGRLLKLIALPISCLTFGFAALAVNAGILLMASSFDFGFHVAGFWSAFFASILISVFNGLFSFILAPDPKKDDD